MSKRPIKSKNFRRGDTMIEVLVSIAIFAFVAMISMNTMSRGAAQAQRTLETTMARNAMDMQSETIQFWNEAASGTGSDARYVANWDSIKSYAISKKDYGNRHTAYINEFTNNSQCPYPNYTVGVLTIGGTASSFNNAFVVNTRDILNVPSYTGAVAVTDRFTSEVAFPQLVYDNGSITNASDRNLVSEDTQLMRVQGIFAFIVAESDDDGNKKTVPAYYNLHIHTCWKTSRLETTLRLGAPRL